MKSKSLKFKIVLTVCVLVSLICLGIGVLYAPIIFSHGNPIPYLIASSKLDDNNAYVLVKETESETIYITKRGEKKEVLQLFAQKVNAELNEQYGGTYFFSDGETRWMVESGDFLRDYTVWKLPINN